jgi:uncharacterized surface protein with fasciclin (FAS1) repeats
VEKAGMNESFHNKTVFLPFDDGLTSEISSERFEELLQDESSLKLFLENHLCEGMITRSRLLARIKEKIPLLTLTNTELPMKTIGRGDAGIAVGGASAAELLGKSIRCKDGIIHVINKPIWIPPPK